MAKVMVACPNTGSIHKCVTASLMNFLIKRHSEHELTFNFQTEKPVDSNRNIIIRDFLASDEGWEYLFFIDSDNPPVDNEEYHPLDLIKLDKDIMALPTPIWSPPKLGRFPIMWNCVDFDKKSQGWREHNPKVGLQKIDAAGSGALIISRRVLEEIKPAFIRGWDKDGVATFGSDFLFCQRATEAGFEVWCDYRYICHHYKTRDLLELFQVMNQRDICHAQSPNINTPEYWDSQWEKRGERVLPVYDVIKDKLEGKRTVLDFGCGRGDFLQILTDSGFDACGIDHSKEAVKICKERGLEAYKASDLSMFKGSRFDAIVCTEVLEHLDDDAGMLKHFFDYTDTVIYSVPHDCMPPGFEREHMRVYTMHAGGRVKEITPYLKEMFLVDHFLLVVAQRDKEQTDGRTQCEPSVSKGN